MNFLWFETDTKCILPESHAIGCHACKSHNMWEHITSNDLALTKVVLI